jgi:hypothetical protein
MLSRDIDYLYTVDYEYQSTDRNQGILIVNEPGDSPKNPRVFCSFFLVLCFRQSRPTMAAPQKPETSSQKYAIKL